MLLGDFVIHLSLAGPKHVEDAAAMLSHCQNCTLTPLLSLRSLPSPTTPPRLVATGLAPELTQELANPRTTQPLATVMRLSPLCAAIILAWLPPLVSSFIFPVPPLPSLSSAGGGTLALLTLPTTPADTVRNMAILDAALSRALPLSGPPPLYLARSSPHLSRSPGDGPASSLTSAHPPLYVSVSPSPLNPRPPTGAVISYVSELYRQVWDHVSTNLLLSPRGDCDSSSASTTTLLDVVIFPHVPGCHIAPRSGLTLCPDVDCVLYDDTLNASQSREEGGGGDEAPVPEPGGSKIGGWQASINDLRKARGSRPLSFHHVPSPPAPSPYVYYADLSHSSYLPASPSPSPSDPTSSHSHSLLYDKVGVAGTFCTLHYGHRLLLTLACLCHSTPLLPPSPSSSSYSTSSSASSSSSSSSGLVVGLVTDGAALRSRRLSGHPSPSVSSYSERLSRVSSFLSKLRYGTSSGGVVAAAAAAVVPSGGGTLPYFVEIDDGVGPAGSDPLLRALVLSSETVGRGEAINDRRREKGLERMDVIAVCRREIEGMSATNLRARGVR